MQGFDRVPRAAVLKISPWRARREARKPLWRLLQSLRWCDVTVAQAPWVEEQCCKVVRILETGCIWKMGPPEFAEGWDMGCGVAVF